MKNKTINNTIEFKKQMDKVMENYSKLDIISNKATITAISSDLNISRQSFYKYLKNINELNSTPVGNKELIKEAKTILSL